MDSNLVAQEIIQDYSGVRDWNYDVWVKAMRRITPRDLENIAGSEEGSELLDADWLPLRDLDVIVKGNIKKTEISVQRLVWWYSKWGGVHFKHLRPNKTWKRALRRALVGCPDTHPEWSNFRDKVHAEPWVNEEMGRAIKTARKAYWLRRKPTVWQRLKDCWMAFKKARETKRNEAFLNQVVERRKNFKPG
jgi:hypothetical protein